MRTAVTENEKPGGTVRPPANRGPCKRGFGRPSTAGSLILTDQQTAAQFADDEDTIADCVARFLI